MTYIGFTCPKCGEKLRFSSPVTIDEGQQAGVLMARIMKDLNEENFIPTLAIAQLAMVYAMHENGSVFAAVAEHKPKMEGTNATILLGRYCGFVGRVELEAA